MTDINGFQLTGRIADEAKYSSTKNGTATLSFCLAVNRDRKINEQWVSKGSFFYLTVYGKRATGLCKILVKGTRIGVQGFLDQDVWTDAAGKKQYRTVFCVENLVLLGQPKTIPENENHIPEIPSHKFLPIQKIRLPKRNMQRISMDRKRSKITAALAEYQKTKLQIFFKERNEKTNF